MLIIVLVGFSLLGAIPPCQGQSPLDYANAGQEAELSAVMANIRVRAYDAIPAIDYPGFVSAAQGDEFLRPGQQIIGVVIGDVAKAYPVEFLNGREVVNDSLARRPITVTW